MNSLLLQQHIFYIETLKTEDLALFLNVFVCGNRISILQLPGLFQLFKYVVIKCNTLEFSWKNISFKYMKKIYITPFNTNHQTLFGYDKEIISG